jgi:hypothetical protein
MTPSRWGQMKQKPVFVGKPPQEAEVEWYDKHGQHPERIAKDGTGKSYVIGDRGWNRNNPHKREYIEHRMMKEGVYG